MRKKLNIRFLLLLLAFLVVFGGGGALAHRFQMDRIAQGYRTQASKAQKEEKFEQEANFLRRYLSLSPEDAEAKMRLGQVLAETAKKPDDLNDAYFVLQDALRLDPKLTEVRRLMARLAMSVGQTMQTEAIRDLEGLIRQNPKDAEAWELKGQCMQLRGDHAEADRAFAMSIQSNPARIESYARKANLLRQTLRRKDDADKVIAQMLQANPKSALAHLAAADYAFQNGDRTTRLKEITIASQLEPRDPTVLLAQADWEIDTADKQPERAEALLKQAKTHLMSLIEAALPNIPNQKILHWKEDGSKLNYRAITTEAFARLNNVLIRLGDFTTAETQARRSLEIFPGNAIHTLHLTDVLIRLLKLDEAEKEIAKLQAAQFKQGYVDYQRGRIAAIRQNWSSAIHLLEYAAIDLANRKEAFRECQLMLARCYERTGDNSKRYEAFRRAIPEDPFDPAFIPAMEGLTATLVALGRIPEAITEYQRLLLRSPAAALPLARLMATQIAQQKVSEEKWAAIDQILSKAPANLTAERDLNKAVFLAVQGKTDLAEQLLTDLCQKQPDYREAWASRIRIAMSSSQFTRAAEMLTLAVKNCGDRPEWMALAIQIEGKNDRKAMTEALAKKATAIRKMTAEQRADKLPLLARMAIELEDRKLARSLCDLASTDHPKDIPMLLQKLDLALLDKDEPAIEEALDQLKTVAGEDSIDYRMARGMFALSKAATDKAALDQATQLLTRVASDRVYAARPQVALGRISEIRGNKAEALRCYRQAFDLGERSTDVIKRMLELYAETKNYEEAGAILKIITNTGGELVGGEGIAADVLVGNKNYVQAAELAVKAVPANSKDPRQHLWLAQILTMAGKVKEAIAPLKRVTELSPEAPEGWFLLTQSLMRTQQVEEARKVVEEARTKMRPADAVLAIPACDELVGNRSIAKTGFAKAMTERPKDPAILRAAASFHLRSGDVDSATPVLERLMAISDLSKDDEAFARRSLGLCLSMSQDKQVSRRGLTLLGITDPSKAGVVNSGDSVEDLRVRAAVLLAIRGRASRLSCITVLDAMEARTPLSGQDHFLYGRAYSYIGEWAKARERFRQSVDLAPNDILFLSQYILSVLRDGDVVEARPLVERVESMDPQSARSLELKVRLAVAEKAIDRAANLVEAWHAKSGDSLMAMRILEACGLGEKAEPYVQKLAAKAMTVSELLMLPSYLARVGKATEAINEFEKLDGKVPKDAILNGITEALLVANAPEAADIERVQKRIESALKEQPRGRVMLAAIESLKNNYAEAGKITRKLLQDNPRDVVALNNMAFLVGIVEGKTEEGIQLIEQAIAIAGPLPTLLDTEAVIELAAKRPEKAVELLRESLSDESSAVTYYHLAQAYMDAGQSGEAKKALAEARRLRLKIGDLFPYERKKYDDTLKAVQR